MNIDEIVAWRDSAEKQIAIEDYRLNSEEALERLKYQVDYSQAALRNLQLVNGGAIVALLTFIGNTDQVINDSAIWWSFLWFSAGLFLSLAAYFGAYLSQSSFMNVAFKQAWQAQHRAQGSKAEFDFADDLKRGNWALYSAISMAVGSLLCFFVGAFVGLSGLA